MSSKFKVLIADNLDSEGVEILEKSGLIEVDFRKKTSREELLDIIPQYDGLIVRSASKVDSEVVERASRLKVVIRAGVGVDNIDIAACSRKGIVVMNAPAGNSVSTAEHALALMFAVARKIPQAHMSMHAKKWEKAKFTGTQLTGKTLGVIGLGRIGKEVAIRALGLKMNVLGYDPYIPRENLEYLQIELTTLDDIFRRADFITVHTPLTESTSHMINLNNLHKLKKGVKIINCARGGIFEEKALAEGIKQGIISGVGIDVFVEEPPSPDMPLYGLEEAVLTPHLGASTDEAQLEVAKETAQSMVEFVRSGVARNSLNFPTLDAEEMGMLKPWFHLCEKLGVFAAQVMPEALSSVHMELRGAIVTKNLKALEIALTKGVLTPALGEEVNLVNAPLLAKQRGLSISSFVAEETKEEPSRLRLVLGDGRREKVLVATVDSLGGLVMSINDIPLEFRPEGHMLFIRNKDVPKVVGELGLLLGEANVNIASLHLGRDVKGGTAMTIISLDDAVPPHVLEKIKAKDYIVELHYITI
ncbi:MAG: phosphoglycerate dehydrogenase [Leptospiraceae bacterium]|nr:phosphoglycerate dehydrogenase [Leptospiraceae bacterium]